MLKIDIDAVLPCDVGKTHVMIWCQIFNIKFSSIYCFCFIQLIFKVNWFVFVFVDIYCCVDTCRFKGKTVEGIVVGVMDASVMIVRWALKSVTKVYSVIVLQPNAHGI